MQPAYEGPNTPDRQRTPEHTALFDDACAKARECGATWLAAHLKASSVTCLSELVTDQLRAMLH